jgi:hypothetical protein
MFSSEKDDGYWKLFGDSNGIVPTLDKRQFRKLAGVWFVCNYAKSVWKTKKDSIGEEEAPWLERRWMFFFALGTLLKLEMSSEGLDEYLIKLGTGEWTRKNEGRGEKDEIEQVAKKAFYVLKKSYEKKPNEKKANVKDGDRTASEHRNWFRDRKTLESIEGEASDITEMN